MSDETREQIKRDATIYAANGETIKCCENCGAHEGQYCKRGVGVDEYACDYVSKDIPDIFSPLRQRTMRAFEDGATRQHAISFEAGRKAGIDEAISLAKDLAVFANPRMKKEFIKELEALKTEIKK